MREFGVKSQVISLCAERLFEIPNCRAKQVVLAGTALACLLTAGSVLAASSVRAADPISGPQLAQAAGERDFSIAAQPLSSALDEYARQTGVSFAYRTADIAGIESPGVNGSYSVVEGLQRLLAGTGVSFRFTGDSAVSLTVSAGSATEDGTTRLGPVVVTAGRPGGMPGEVNITAEDLARRNPQTLREVFQGESDISVGGAIPAAQKVYVNGVEETNLAVTVDGARQNNKVFHHNTTNLIDPQMLKSVRVDPGVAPADAGAAALAGSIEYETVDVGDLLPAGQNIGGFATLTYNTNGSVFTNGLAGYGRSSGFEVMGYVNWGRGNDYEDGNGNTVPGTETDFYSFLAKGAYQSKTGHRFEVSAQQTQDDADRPYRANIGRIDGTSNPDTRQYRLKNDNYVFRYELAGADGLIDPRVLVAYSQSRSYVPDPYGSDGTAGGWNGKVENVFHLNEIDTVTAGLDFYSNRASYEDPTSSATEKAKNVGLYGQARLRPLEPLGLTFGARIDNQWFTGVDGSEATNAGLSGNVAAEYQALDFLTLNAGFSSVWGGIALDEPYIFNPSWTYDDLKPVRANNAVLGFEVNYQGISFEAGVFHTEFSNYRDASYRGGAFIPVDFTSKGYNLGIGYNWGPGFAQLNFTDSKIDIDGNAVDSFTGQYLGATLGQIFAFEAGHHFEDIGLSIGGSIQAALENDDLVDQGYQKLDPYQLVNLYAEYQPKELDFLTLRLDVTNLFDEEYADRATYGQEFSTVTPLMQPGRSFLLTARARF